MGRFPQLTAAAGCFLLLASSTLATGLSSAAPEAPHFTAQVDLEGYPQPILTLTNDRHPEPVEVEVVALDEHDHQHRRHSILLEAGGQSTLGLQSLGGFDRLILNAPAELGATLEDAASGQSESFDLMDASVLAPAQATKAATQCDGTWNLTCIHPRGCTYVSGYKSGRVENGNQVYWNLHTPTGAWTTQANGCSTTWYGVQANGCPSYAYNCLGQTYSISHNLPPQGPDLIITNVSFSPNPVTSGDDIVVYYTVKNIGDVTVTARYQENFWLKPASGAATLLRTSSTYGQDIPPGGSVNLAETVTVSGAAGSYTLQVEADGGYAIAESNESNNKTGVPITVNPPANGQLTIHGLIFNPGSGNGWTFALENCPQGSLCTRSFELESTGSTDALVFITDNSDSNTTVTDNCPTYLAPGLSCFITIQHTLPNMVAKRDGGELSVYNATPSQPDYEICISDDATLCR